MADIPIFDMFISFSSDDEVEIIIEAVIEEEQLERERGSRSRCGSIQRRRFIRCDSLQAHERLFSDYFAESPIYTSNIFRRRCWVNCSLFLRILHEVEAHEPYFVQKRNSAGRLRLNSLQKMTAALRMLAYGVTIDFMDEYLKNEASTAMTSLKKFCKAMVSIFSNEYLRSPNNNDIARLLAKGRTRGFSIMLESINCMHWKWKNCPTAWHGMFSGHVQEPTIILEAVASFDLWIWHAFFGLSGSHNDINVLERSPIFAEIVERRTSPVNYSVNGNDYTMGYYLTDGIYPSRSTLVKIISSPQGNKRKHFAAAQESTRKDVERAFGALQARFAIVRGPARLFRQEALKDIMTSCIILHNMIIENEQHADETLTIDYEQIDERPHDPVSREHTPEFMEFIQRHHHIRNRETHSQLEHLCQLHSDL